ncbi:N-lysine methyltransferase SETD6 [Grifola frondosa]|uniref:N-lysine methyltransferase SETD6 n=1 Tax=Grifola frondosa TaxID=5627 RepID=A0A1C7M2C0_GRIFR|nr:N-lysine methyltransferase SETD6 [Grifola frondosa]
MDPLAGDSLSTDSLATLLTWTTTHGIIISPSIRVVDHGPTGNIAVVSVLSEPILPSSTLVSIPKTAILSVRSCSIAERIPFVPYGHGATLALSLGLYYEILQPVPIAILWNVSNAFPGDEDGVEAYSWLTGTEVEKELKTDEGQYIIEEIRQYYITVVQPILSNFIPSPSLVGFLYAYSLVSSRAFLVDAYHGLSMVPIADAFNHAYENHVQLERLRRLPRVRVPPRMRARPRSSPSASALPPAHMAAGADTVDMVTSRAVPPHAEVFNTYGRLGSAALLARYGFALEGGEADGATFGWVGSGICGLRAEDGGVGGGADREFARMYGTVRSACGERLSGLLSEDNAMVYVPGSADGRAGPCLCINAEAQVSMDLWLWAAVEALFVLQREGVLRLEGADEAAMLLETVIHLQNRIEGADKDHDVGDQHKARRVLAALARTLSALCRSRVARMGKRPALDTAQLGALLDNLPPDRPKTRLAVAHVLGERVLLESCTAGCVHEFGKDLYI